MSAIVELLIAGALTLPELLHGRALLLAKSEEKEPTIVAPATIIDIASRMPNRPRPRLASTTRQPVGAALDFLHDGLEIVALAQGSR